METNLKNSKIVQEIKFGMGKDEFKELANTLLTSKGTHVKFSFGVNENYILCLSISSEGDGRDGSEKDAIILACPPKTNCPGT